MIERESGIVIRKETDQFQGKRGGRRVTDFTKNLQLELVAHFNASSVQKALGI